MFLALAFACGGPPSGVPTPVEPAEPAGTCTGGAPCVANIAAAQWVPTGDAQWAGFALAGGAGAVSDVVFVGRPSLSIPYPSVAALSVADLGWIGAWEDSDPEGSAASSRFGHSIAATIDGSRIVVGAPSGADGPSQKGAVYVFTTAPTGTLDTLDPVTTIYGDASAFSYFGTKVAYLDLTGNGPELVAGTENTDVGVPNGIYRFDSNLTGEHGLGAATAVLLGGPFLGQDFAGWDSDGDGLDELVALVEAGVAHFPAPWLGDRAESDADAVFTESYPEFSLGFPTKLLDDLDGDGLREIAFGENTYSAEVVRQGVVFIVPGGTELASMPAEELTFQVRGDQLGDGLGAGVASGDFDGDGQMDLAVGAMGLVPARLPGRVLGFLGPLDPAVWTPDQADFVVYGEREFDWFGAELVTVHSDGDTRDDLVVSAQGAAGTGSVYLLLGRDLVE